MPRLLDKHDGIVAGHGRVEAAKQLGLATVPTIRLEHLSEAQTRAYILADNKLAEKAGWGREILAIELQNLMEIDLGFDISINAAMESFFSTLKTERTAAKVYRSRDAARADVFDYIKRFYNPRRRHSTLGYVSPVDYEERMRVA